MKKVFAILLAFVMVFAFAACGESAEVEETNPPDAGSPAVEETGSPDAGDDTKELTALICSVAKPLSLIDSDGVIQGYEYDVLCAINEIMDDYTFEIVPCTDEVQNMRLETGDFDLSVGGYMWNEEREADYAVPETPIGATAFVLYVRPEDADKITCMQDVIDGGYTFGPVFPNGGIYKAMVEWNEANGSPLDEIPVQADISVAERIELVVSGQCDVYVETVNTDVEEVAAEMGVELVQVEEPLTAEKTVVLIKKEDTELCEAVNNALSTLMENGTLVELSNKWYGYDIFSLIE